MAKIGILTPIMSHIVGECYESLVDAHLQVVKAGHEVEMVTCLDLVPYDRAREFLIGKAFDAGCDYLWWIDSDCIVPKGAFDRLMLTMTEHEAAIVTAHNYMRGYPYVCGWWKSVEGGPLNRVDARSGQHEITTGSLHCVLVDVKWLLAHKFAPWFKYAPYVDEEHRVMEDAWFYAHVWERGGKVIGDADVRTGHVYTRVVACDKTVKVLRSMHNGAQDPNFVSTNVATGLKFRERISENG